MTNAILEYMNAKKIIFAFFAFAFFISGNAFAAGKPVLYTQPYNPDGSIACPPCARLEGMLNSISGYGEHIFVTGNAPSNITSVPTLVFPDGRQVVGPEAIASSVQKYVDQQINKPKPPVVTTSTPKPQPTNNPPRPNVPPRRPSSVSVPPEQISGGEKIIRCESAPDSGRYSYRCITASGRRMVFNYNNSRDPGYVFFQSNVDKPLYMDATGHAQLIPISQPNQKPKPSDLSDMLPLIPGDPGYEPPAGTPTKPTPPENSDWNPAPQLDEKKVIVTRNGDHFIVTFPDGSQSKVTMKEVAAFYQQAKNRTDLEKDLKEAAIAIIARGLGGVPMARVQPPKPELTKYNFKILTPSYLDAGLWVIKGQVCKVENGREVSCSPFTMQIPVYKDGVAVNTADEAIAIAKEKAENGPSSKTAPSVVPSPKPKPVINMPDDVTRPARPYKRGGVVADPFVEPSAEDIKKAELQRKIKEIQAKDAALKAREEELLKGKYVLQFKDKGGRIRVNFYRSFFCLRAELVCCRFRAPIRAEKQRICRSGGARTAVGATG
mgnify:CR=1 FL=1